MAALPAIGLKSLDGYRVRSLRAGLTGQKNFGLRRGKNRHEGKVVLNQLRPFQSLKNFIGKDPAGGIPVRETPIFFVIPFPPDAFFAVGGREGLHEVRNFGFR
jgi:hypothetical protein